MRATVTDTIISGKETIIMFDHGCFAQTHANRYITTEKGWEYGDIAEYEVNDNGFALAPRKIACYWEKGIR